jgi:predicted dehydrogenase
MTARREFLAGLAAAPAVLAQRNPNDKIGVAVVGVGTRGYFLFTEFQKIPNTEVRVICDLYDGNIRRAQQAATYKDMRVIKEWEKAVEAPEVDAVVIATPDFWHAPMVIKAAQAKKDIYVEKGWCRTLDEAKKMRKAIKDNGVVMQLGHNYNSMPTFHKAREIFQSGALGKTPLIRLYIDRTNPHPEWQFYTAYDVQQAPADASPQTIDWQRFTANASKRPFDVERFFTWRRWWEYGTGIAGDLMSHLWDSANMVAGLGIPEGMQTQGGQYFWKDGRDVPDMWNVVMDYPSKETAVTFSCSFHSRHQGELEQFLGRDLTMDLSPGFLRTWEAEWKPEFRQKYGRNATVQPVYEYKKGDVEVSDHWTNFIDSMRTRQKPRCDVDRAFEEAAVIAMSVEAYKRERRVKWDPAKEAIV